MREIAVGTHRSHVMSRAPASVSGLACGNPREPAVWRPSLLHAWCDLMRPNSDLTRLKTDSFGTFQICIRRRLLCRPRTLLIHSFVVGVGGESVRTVRRKSSVVRSRLSGTRAKRHLCNDDERVTVLQEQVLLLGNE